jgi:hypothetical protein
LLKEELEKYKRSEDRAAEKLLQKEELEKDKQSEDSAAEKAQRDKEDTMYVHTYVHDEDEVMVIMTATMVV